MITSQYIEPARDAVVVPASTAYDCLAEHGKVCTVVANEDGDLVCTTQDGSTITFPMVAGQPTLFALRSIAASSAISVTVLVWG